jgi:hypothetical protein
MRAMFFRSVVVAALAAGLLGCGAKESGPLVSHGKPVSHWVQELQSSDAKARKQAVKALGHFGPADPAVVPALAGALKDRDASVRVEAALALLNIGPAAQAASPALTEAQNDRDAKVREYAAKALERLRGAGSG